MELIKETNGWKLYKEPNVHKFEIETPEGFKSITNRISFTINEFDRMVERGFIWLDREYFTGQIINGKIEVEKHKKQIQSSKQDLFLKNHSITKEDVIEKLKPILIKAKDKFENCRQKLVLLQNELEFDVNYMMLGDTHGIYEDYLYISFTIDGIFCKFEFND